MAAIRAQTEEAEARVAKILGEVNSAASEWNKALAKDQEGDDTAGEVSQARSQLIRKVWSLYSTTKGPADMIHDHLEKVSMLS